MSKRVFRVKYQQKWSDYRDWIGDESTTVLASDAERAIVAARKYALGMVAEPEEKGGKPTKVIAFRLLEVAVVTEVDVLT